MIGGSHFINQQIYDDTQSLDTEILSYNYTPMKNLDMIDICYHRKSAHTRQLYKYLFVIQNGSRS